MKLVILGATGGTGLCLVNEALSRGHEVTALVRNPDKITVKNDKLSVVETDIYDSAKIVEHVRGCDAVLSTVGGRGGFFVPCDIYTSTGKAAISAMRESGVKRFICITSWGTKDDPNLPFIWRWVLKPTLARNIVKNMDDLEEHLVNECTDINFTVVRPPHLLNGTSSGKAMRVSAGRQCVTDYTVSAVTRQDVAKFMLECLGTSEYDNKMVAITTS